MRVCVFACVAGCSFSNHVDQRGDAGRDTPVTTDARPDSSPDATPSTTFIIEAEAFSSETTTTHDWTAASTIAGHRGTGYMFLAPDNSSPCTTMATVTTCGASLVFDVTIAQTGTYYFFARMFASNGSHDSVWFGVDGLVLAVVDVVEDSQWHWGGGVASVMPAGAHTLHVWQREGARVDVVALMPTNAAPP